MINTICDLDETNYDFEPSTSILFDTACIGRLPKPRYDRRKAKLARNERKHLKAIQQYDKASKKFRTKNQERAYVAAYFRLVGQL